MKKKAFLFLSAALLATAVSFAQKKFTEGVIQYDVVINTGAGKAQAAAFMDGATTTVYLKGNKSRSEMVSSLGTQATVIDGARNSIVILKDYGSQKYMINLTPANWQEMNRKYQGVQYTLVDSSKLIAGYNCKKAVGKLADGTPLQVWYTTELQVDNPNVSVLGNTLPGLALEYQAVMENLDITYTVSRITQTAVPAARFDLPKAGYRVMSYEESKGKGGAQ